MNQQAMIAEASGVLAKSLGVPVAAIYPVSFRAVERPTGGDVQAAVLHPIAVLELGLERRLFVVRAYPNGPRARYQWHERQL